MSMEQKADARQTPTSTSLQCAAPDSLPALESSTTLSQSSNCTPLSSTNSSDPKLNDVLHALLNDDACSREDTAVYDHMTPSGFDLWHFLFPLTLLPQSADLPSQGVSQPASIEQVVDTLQPTTSTAQSHPSSPDCLHTLPAANSNLPPSASTSGLPSSAYSDPEMCTFNNETSSREKMTPEMEYLFDLFPLIPGVAWPLSAEKGVDMSTSIARSTVSGSLSTLPILDSSPQPGNCAPASSTHSSEPERNNALHVLLDDNMCSREDTMASGEMTPSLSDLPLFLFPLTPLPHSDLPSQGVSQPASIEQVVDTLQPTTSTAQSHLSSPDCLHALPVANSNLPPSASTSGLPSSAYSDPEMCTFNNDTSSREKMTPEMEYLLNLFPLIPLPNSTDLPLQGVARPQQGVDMSTSSACSTFSGSISTLPILDSNTTSPQPSNCVPASSTHSSEPGRNNSPHTLLDDNMCSREDTMASGEMTPSISDLPLFLFPLSPLPHTDLLSQGVSQPASTEQVVDTVRPSAQSHLSNLDCLHDLSMTNSNLPPSPMPNTTALPSSAYSNPEACTVDENSNREKMASEMGCFFDLFPLIPLSQNTDLPSQGVSQPTLMEQGADMLQPPTSTAPPHLLPGDKVTNMCIDEISSSRQCSHSSTLEDEDITPVCTHINPDPPAESLCIQSASTGQSMARSSSLVPPSGFHLKKNAVIEKSSPETSSQVEVDSSDKAHNCKKQKLEKIVSEVQHQQQRRLNNVSALRYRQRRRERESELAVRMEQLEAENTRLKERVSALTTEIDEMKKKLLQKNQRTKVCPFFLHSTCSKLN